MRNRRDNRAVVPAMVCSGLLLGPLAAVQGQQESTSVTHFIDTSTDRTPALTAFPEYPSIARRDRIEGEATVCFKIKANGRISRPVVTEYSHKIFSRPALRAIKKSFYEPLGPGQVLQTARSCRTYRFRLEPIRVDEDPERQRD